MPSTSRGYRYPAASAAPNVPLDIQNLAADLNTDVGDVENLTVRIVTSATRPSSPVEGWTIYETDTNSVMVYNGTAWHRLAFIPGIIFARNTVSTTVNASTTMVNITGLSVAVEASAVYILDSWIMYSSSIAADIKFTWTFPAAATLSWSAAGYASTVAGGGPGDLNANAREREGSAGTSLVYGGINVGGGTTARMGGLLIMGANAGTLQPQMCQSSSDATNTVVHPDSWIKLERVA